MTRKYIRKAEALPPTRKQGKVIRSLALKEMAGAMNDHAPKIRCSNARSGFNLYLPEAAVGPLAKTSYSVEVRKEPDDSGFMVRLRPNEGNSRLTVHGNADLPYRLSVRELRGSGLSINDLDLFGVVEVAWQHVTNGDVALQFYLPRLSELPAPLKLRRRTHSRYTGRQLAHGLPAPEATETPHAHLGRLLREVNALLASGTVDDVEIRMETLDGDAASEGQIAVAIGKKASLTQIKGRVVREEILG
jgi:hypothetical protein